MNRLFGNDYWTLDRDPARPLLIVRRTAVPYPTIVDLTRAFDELEAATSAAGRSGALLVDMRDSPSRNDPEFERATASHPRRFGRGFTKVAILVRTKTGLLQITRSTRAGNASGQAFLSEAEALDYLFLKKGTGAA